MTAQPVQSVQTDDFLVPALDALRSDGFITDEHEFAPYRETINVHVAAIQKALEKRGFKGKLAAGYLNHGQAGYAYFIYDTKRFTELNRAKRAIDAWLTKRYGG